MLRAILLDLGRVIVPFDFMIGYRAMEERCGVPVAEIRERIRSTGLVPRFETGLIEPEEFVSSLSQGIGLQVTYDEFSTMWSSIFSRETLLSEEFLERLHRRYPLVLVSNTNALHFEMIRREYPLLRHFDKWILSYEVKSMKPDSGIFAAAVTATGCKPAECFFTDDIAEYVDGARRFGIDAVQFENREQLERELRERGVDW